MDSLLVAEVTFVVINSQCVCLYDAALWSSSVSNAIKLHLMNPLGSGEFDVLWTEIPHINESLLHAYLLASALTPAR